MPKLEIEIVLSQIFLKLRIFFPNCRTGQLLSIQEKMHFYYCDLDSKNDAKFKSTIEF